MKRSGTIWSLFILVTFFLWIQPWQTTYAYFTDSVSVDGNLKLKLGTLSLAEIPSQNVTIKQGTTTAELSPVIKNTGSLDGQLTIKEVNAKMGGTPINVEDYLKVITTSLPLKVSAGEQKPLVLQFEKIKDWPEATPITLSINLRISQENLVEENQGFIDEKILEIIVKNEQPWPVFEGDTYIKKNTYYSVVNENYTSVIPGELYLKEESLNADQVANVLKNLKVTSEETATYHFDVEYIQGKGFHFTNIKIIGQKEKEPNNSMNLKIVYPLGQWQSRNITIDAFAQPFILSSDIVNDTVKVPTEIILEKENQSKNLTFYTYNNQSGEDTKVLNEEEKAYIKENLAISLSDNNYFTVKYTEDYSGLIVTRADNRNNQRSTIMLKRGSEIVFSREVIGSTNGLMHATEASEWMAQELPTLSTETQEAIIDSKAVTEESANAEETGLTTDDASDARTPETTTTSQEESVSTTSESTSSISETESSRAASSEMTEAVTKQQLLQSEPNENPPQSVARTSLTVIAREEEINQTQAP